jgi:hypothetical protein
MTSFLSFLAFIAPVPVLSVILLVLTILVVTVGLQDSQFVGLLDLRNAHAVLGVAGAIVMFNAGAIGKRFPLLHRILHIVSLALLVGGGVAIYRYKVSGIFLEFHAILFLFVTYR